MCVSFLNYKEKYCKYHKQNCLYIYKKLFFHSPSLSFSSPSLCTPFPQWPPPPLFIVTSVIPTALGNELSEIRCNRKQKQTGRIWNGICNRSTVYLRIQSGFFVSNYAYHLCCGANRNSSTVAQKDSVRCCNKILDFRGVSDFFKI